MSSHYYALVANPARDLVLLTRRNAHTDAGWTLPHLPITENFWWQDVGPVNRAAHNLFGWPATTLQCLHIHGKEGDTSAWLVYALEPHSPDNATPDGMCWTPVDELQTLSLEWPEQGDIIQSWLAQREPAVAWYRPAWRDEALRWATTQLAELGLAIAAPPEQVRAWERSALWRFHTTRGKVYFKAVTATFAHEPRLTKALGDWHPRWFPSVLAIDDRRHWMLLGDAGEHNGNTRKSLADWETGLRAYGEMQAAFAPQIDDLLKLGVPDRRPNILRDQIERLLGDTVALKNSPAGLSDDEVATLRARSSIVFDACVKLATCPIPASLEHGDFSPGQIIYGNSASGGEALAGSCRFIDWSDSSVSFPFFGAQFFWEELEGELPDPAEARVRLREAYLQSWVTYAPMPELLEIFQAAMLVAPFYYATIYHQHILPSMTFKWEMERMLPYYLRIALK